MNMKADQACTEPNGACAGLPELVRMNYFHGQLISDRDLRTEQDYFRARLRHANRCLHGYGVLCGLEIQPVPGQEDCPPEDEERRAGLRDRIESYDKKIEALRQSAGEQGADVQAIEKEVRELEGEREALRRELEAPGNYQPPAQGEEPDRPGHVVMLGCGAAIDCEGNDIIVRQPVPVDLDDLLECAPDDGHGHEEEQEGDSGQREGKDGARYVYLSICYRECGREPTRPFELDECATSIRCHDARVAEGWKLVISRQRPPEDTRCELCCDTCADPCLLLARIRIGTGRPIGPEDIDHSVRRRFGLYEPTMISGIGWRHGFDYSFDTAYKLLGSRDPNGGLEIRFSRPVRRSTLARGVVDLWRITGGRGGAGEFLNMEAEYVGLPADPDAMVDRIRVRNGSEERVQSKDRVLIIVRAAFILDACCRPVDGAHIGGRVPRLEGDDEATKAALEEEKEEAPPGGCERPPHGPVPWTTGAGGNFESWFYISEA